MENKETRMADSRRHAVGGACAACLVMRSNLFENHFA
jgi:hypothetical protein